MVSSDLGACEWFVWDLRRSGLIDRGQLDQVIGEFLRKNPRAEPPALADYLVSQQVLTPYQAQRILDGKTQGLVLGPYILADTIGSGSMGQVYKATSKTDNQWYAVKVLPRRSMWNVRLARRQVRAFASFNAPAVVPFVDVGTSGGLHYLVWPLVEGETLEARVKREGQLSPAQTALIGLHVAQGLAGSHQNGLFHGLLKPSNIMIGKDGQARLLDFGIGSLLVENEGESLVDTMSTANTLTSGLDCAAPECILEPTARTPAGDQYSLGCVLYFCLAGRVPYEGENAVEKMISHQFKQPQPLREITHGVPDGLNAIIERLMQKAPESRYAGCDEVAEALQPYAIETPQPRRGFSNFPASAPSMNLPKPSAMVPPPAAPATRNPARVSAELPRPLMSPPSPMGAPLPGVSRPVMPQGTPIQPLPRPVSAPPAMASRPMMVPPPATPQSRPTPQEVANAAALRAQQQLHSSLSGASPLPERTPEPVQAGMITGGVATLPQNNESGSIIRIAIMIGAGALIAAVYFLGKTFLG